MAGAEGVRDWCHPDRELVNLSRLEQLRGLGPAAVAGTESRPGARSPSSRPGARRSALR